MLQEKMTFKATDLEEIFYSRTIAEGMGYEQVNLEQNEKKEWVLEMKPKNGKGTK